MNKIHVQKRGPRSFRIYLDSVGNPIPISSPEQEVEGMLQLFNSIQEVQAAFPRYEPVILEAEAKPPKLITKSPEIRAEAQKYMERFSKKTTQSSNSTESIKSFLNGLELAKQSASKKSIKTLDIQIDVIKKLLQFLEGQS